MKKEQFINELEHGWDNAITTLEKELKNNATTGAPALKKLCEVYWEAYDQLDPNDHVDDGIVGAVRSNIINTISEALK